MLLLLPLAPVTAEAAPFAVGTGQNGGIAVDGLYLCGAATHPAGSVIALNGRNAAMAVLEDAAQALSLIHI